MATLAAGMAGAGALAQAQIGAMGQGTMAPSGGVLNRAVTRLSNLNENGPGWMYFGLNPADRGLGYNGSYMTLGGFIPYAEDDLGGFWAADLRGHLSVNGGFFSNVGAVRKQFLGGTLLGIGVYWDYDGDQNQYPTGGALGTEQFGQFGHSYNQVGISGEWLTDYGNLRSNGYIPVGRTAHTAGNPGSVFYQNYVMCQYGLDTALTGTDLEVGAYVPGLSDWAGMISVGGYALGNSRYDWSAGSLVGNDVVPWFGGVYTRLDLTLRENWDFSIQYNNDSYFDSTGFVRLTYRMGGSRRRNVPDQVEQPMMRNEHIVRAHQTPEVAINPSTNEPWRVIHVNNTFGTGGNGTSEAPYGTLAAANAAATNPWDIVIVARGDGTSTGYDTQFSFNAPNQSLAGLGGAFLIDTLDCGPINIGGPAGTLPLLSNPAGTSILIDGNVAGGARVANLQITGSAVGIYGTGNLTGLPAPGFPTGRPTLVNNVSISGSGTDDPQQGVYLEDTTGSVAFTNTAIANMTQGGLIVDGGNATVDYQGSITNDSTNAATPASYLVTVQDMTSGTVNVAVGAAPASATVQNKLSDTGGGGLLITANASGTTINMANVSLKDTVSTGIAVLDDSATTSIAAAAGRGIEKSTAGAAISIESGSPAFTWQGPISNSSPGSGPASYLLNVSDTSSAAVSIFGPSLVDTGNGVQVLANKSLELLVDGATITSAGGTGILLNGNDGAGGDIKFQNIVVDDATFAGVLVNNNPAQVEFINLTLNLTSENAIGFQAANSGNIVSLASNSISTASITQPAVSITDSGILNMTFTSVTSAVPAGTNKAMSFTGTSSGTFTVTSSFTVDGTKGTVANDVTDTTGGAVTVAVPP